MTLRIDEAEVCGKHSLHLVFNDGTQKRVNLLPLLEGLDFAPVRNPSYFRRVVLDRVAGTVVWPDGADLPPQALYELPEEAEESKPLPEKTG